MDSIITDCPVPAEQQPLNEYEALRESWFFRWAVLERGSYLSKLFWVWGFSWLVAGPVAAASFPPGKQFSLFLISGSIGAGILLFLVLLRLYLGWRYIRDRLLQETIVYEESGWYDGQSWSKPLEVLTRDRLIVSYQVQPVVRHLELTLGALLLMMLAGGLLGSFLN